MHTGLPASGRIVIRPEHQERTPPGRPTIGRNPGSAKPRMGRDPSPANSRPASINHLPSGKSGRARVGRRFKERFDAGDLDQPAVQ